VGSRVAGVGEARDAVLVRNDREARRGRRSGVPVVLVIPCAWRHIRGRRLRLARRRRRR